MATILYKFDKKEICAKIRTLEKGEKFIEFQDDNFYLVSNKSIIKGFFIVGKKGVNKI